MPSKRLGAGVVSDDGDGVRISSGRLSVASPSGSAVNSRRHHHQPVRGEVLGWTPNTGMGGALSTLGDDEQLGARLRALRQAKGLSAREAADRAGVTAAYFSRLENGKVSPTVASLTRIMHALGEPVATLFGGDDTSDSPVVRHADRQLVRSHGVKDYRVTPSWADRLEILETVVAAGKGSGAEPYAHPGDQECVLIMDGKLDVWLGDRRHQLTAGDSITFSCRVPHRWRNPGRASARALWVITPSSY